MLCLAFRSADSQEQPIVDLHRPFSPARFVIHECLLMLSIPRPVTNLGLIPHPSISTYPTSHTLAEDFIKHSGMTFSSEPLAEAHSGTGRLPLGIK